MRYACVPVSQDYELELCKDSNIYDASDETHDNFDGNAKMRAK